MSRTATVASIQERSYCCNKIFPVASIENYVFAPGRLQQENSMFNVFTIYPPKVERSSVKTNKAAHLAGSHHVRQ